MFMLTAASNRAGRSLAPRFALPLRGSLLLVALSATAAVALPAGAQTAQDILKKVENVYAKANSYQGSMTIKQSGKGRDGKPATVTQTQQIKYQGPNKVRVQVTATGTGSAAADAPKVNSTVVSDGKSMYVYNIAMKQYMKRPAPPTFPLRQLLATVIPNSATQNVKLLAPATVAGRPVFVLEIKQTLPPNAPPETKAQFAKVKPAQVMIDKQSYQVVRIRRSAAENSLEVTFGPQSFNKPLPGSTFAFTPPPGVKEFVPPANPAGGGVPGLPGGGGAPPPGGGAPR
jgi:outer membrane lipoprotein-sorting protein